MKRLFLSSPIVSNWKSIYNWWNNTFIFCMSSSNFMNVVRFKLKQDCVEKYFEVINKTDFEGMTKRYIAKTGNYDYCFVGIWESAEAIAAQRSKMIAHLDEVRGFMEELSPELGVTDPVSGNIVA